jgi:PKD repeat protein
MVRPLILRVMGGAAAGVAALGLLALLALLPPAAAFVASDGQYEARDNQDGAGGPPNVWGQVAPQGSLAGWSCPASLNGGSTANHNALPAGFDFAFYGNPVRWIRPDVHGLVAFHLVAGGAYPSPIPSGGSPDTMAALWWSDLRPDGADSGSICYRALAAGTDDEVVVYAIDGVRNSPRLPTSQRVNAAMLVFERGDAIEFHYGPSAWDPPAFGVSIGIERGPGTGISYRYHDQAEAPFAMAGEAVQFRPLTSFPEAAGDGDTDGDGHVDHPAYLLPRDASRLAVGAADGVLANDHPIGNVPARACAVGASAAACSGAMALASEAGGNVTLWPDGSFAYARPPGFCGVDRFEYRLDDPFPDDASAPYTDRARAALDLQDGCNHGPRARPDRYQVAEDHLLEVPAPGVLGNDTDDDGDALTAAMEGAPFPPGTEATLRPDGSFTLRPPAGYCGAAGFDYQASDGSVPGRARAEVEVACVPDTPVAEPDSHWVMAGGSLALPAPGVLGNDRDEDGDALAVLQPGAYPGSLGGLLALAADGSFTYAAPAIPGTETYHYQPTDGALAGEPATLRFRIVPPGTQRYWFAPLPGYRDPGGGPFYPTLAATSPGPGLPGSMGIVDGAGATVAAAAVPAGGTVTHTLEVPNPQTGLFRGTGYRMDVTGGIAGAYYHPIDLFYVADAGRLIPEHALGTDHRVLAWDTPGDLSSYIVVVATQDGTRVTVTPTAPVAGRNGVPTLAAGVPATFTLDAFDTLVLGGDTGTDLERNDLPPDTGDLTGSRVESSRPVAVYAGHRCGNVGDSTCNHLSEAVPPTTLAGRDYVLCGTSGDRRAAPGFDQVRVLALDGPANITLTPAPASVPGGRLTLAGAGAWAGFPLRGDVRIEADARIAVAAYYGKDNQTDRDGDPSMVLLTPMDRYGPMRTFYVPPEWHLELSVAQPAGATTLLDGTRMGAARPIPGTPFECSHTPLEPGTHQVASDVPVSASVWATQAFDSFWFEPGGELRNNVGFDAEAVRSCVGSSFRFTDRSEVSRGRRIVAWAWDFGDGGTATGPEVDHGYAAPGVYLATLAITDDLGNVYRTTPGMAVHDEGPLSCLPPEPWLGPSPDHRLPAGRTVRACRPAASALPSSTWSIEGMPASAHVADGCLVWATNPLDAGSHAACFVLADAPGTLRSCFTILVYVPERPEVTDADQDGIADLQDNCPTVDNRGQHDANRNGVGDACDGGRATRPRQHDRPGGAVAGGDLDRDGIGDSQDNCPARPNRDQRDLDLDGEGDPCDPDLDGDGVADLQDNCAATPNPTQADTDRNGSGDACSPAGAHERRLAPAGAAAAPPPGAGAAAWPAAVAAVAAAFVAALAALAWRGRALLVIAFSRLNGTRLADHPVRGLLLDAVAAQPGTHFSELVRLSGRGRGTVAHHLGVLARAGQVVPRRIGGSLCYYPAGLPPGGVGKPALRSATARRVHDLVAREPGISASDLAHRLGISYHMVRYHLHRLEAQGLLRLGRRPLAAHPA